METIYLILAIYFMFAWLYRMGAKAGIFDKPTVDTYAAEPTAVEAMPKPLRAEKKFVRLETTEQQDYDNIYSVGGFASYDGKVGQVVYLSGGMAKIEIFSDCGNSKKSDILDVPITELNPVTQITWKTIR